VFWWCSTWSVRSQLVCSRLGIAAELLSGAYEKATSLHQTNVANRHSGPCIAALKRDGGCPVATRIRRPARELPPAGSSEENLNSDAYPT
jgi:hypothetical protein